jgi:hypothetical protein
MAWRNRGQSSEIASDWVSTKTVALMPYLSMASRQSLTPGVASSMVCVTTARALFK